MEDTGFLLVLYEEGIPKDAEKLGFENVWGFFVVINVSLKGMVRLVLVS